ncbi:MAG: ion channel [Bacteroidia bacterium]
MRKTADPNYLHLPGGNSIFYYWVIYMISESLLYTATLVFCNDIFAKPRSYKRNIILLLTDYFEIVIGFASLYLMTLALQFANGHKPVIKSIDAAYFSFVSSLTIGYGDIIVINDIGKKLVILQSIVFLIYGVLFLNFYTSRIEEKK